MLDFEQVRQVAEELVEFRWHLEAADLVAENVPPPFIGEEIPDERGSMISAIVVASVCHEDYDSVRDIVARYPYDLDVFARSVILSSPRLAGLLPTTIGLN